MHTEKTILVYGSTGQLGNEIKELQFQYPLFKFVFFSRSELSITDQEKVKKSFAEYEPDYVINAAAYTLVDKAEEEKHLAHDINATAMATLAELCKTTNTKLIHISTDYVFDGTSKHPLKESDPVNPVNEYGRSKLSGEQLCTQNNPDVIIIRTSWLYSHTGKNFVKTMIRLMNERESINVVNDQIGSPTNAADLANTILHIISSDKWMPGIYHFSNAGTISWYEFALEIKKLINSNCIINPISSDQFPTPAKRPQFSVMNKEKIETTYGICLLYTSPSPRDRG